MIRMLISALFVATAFSATVPAQAGPPIRYLKAKVHEARALLAKKAPKGSDEAKQIDKSLRAVLEPVLNFDRMSENALRVHWPNLSSAQRTEFVALFQALLFHSYMTRIRTADEAYSIQYEGEEAKGRKAATVTAIAQTRKAEIELVFHLITADGNVWVVEDIVIDEVSLVDNYREQFNRIIVRNGYSVLLQKMVNKLASLGGVVPPEVTSVKPAPKKNEAPVAPQRTAKPAPGVGSTNSAK